MKFFILILSSLFLCAGASMAQRGAIDSLKAELRKANEDTTKLKLLNNLSIAWQSKNELDSGVKYATDATVFSEKLLKRDLDDKQRSVISEELARAFVSMGVIETYAGNYTEALKDQLAALKIFEQINDLAPMASCYLNIGALYYYQGNNEEALKNYQSALKLFQLTNNDYYTAQAYNNIGVLYINAGNYAEALKTLFTSLKISEQAGDQSGMANSYNNIGEVYAKQGNYAEALKNHMATLKIRESLVDERGVIICYNNIGSDYTALGKYSEAVAYLGKALEMAGETNYREIIKDIYFSFSEVYKKKNDFGNAFKYLTLYNGLKDSLANENIGKQMAEMNAKYEAEKKDKEINLLNKDKEIQTIKIERQRSTGKYLIGGFVLLILFSLVAFNLYNQKKKTAFDRRVAETELKALRSQMNPHFTFNVLNSIQYYVSENDLESVELYLEKFSSLIRMILDQSRTTYISLEQEVTMLKLYLDLEEMRFEKKFIYTLDVDPQLDPAKTLLPGMLIQPLVENAIKHGIEHKSGEAVVNITFSAKDNTLLCNVTDNGIGREEAARLKSEKRGYRSVATSITKERMEALGSIYNIELTFTTTDLYNADQSPAGTRVSIEIPFLIDRV